MAIDNLNFYNTGLPAGQLTDRYSSQPGCLRSKNLDIFSSSKSVKATAWSNPTQGDADVIKQDGKLLLKTDGKVYERTANGDVLVVDPSVNFPVYQISYTGRFGTYADAQRGNPQDLVAKYEGDTLKSFVVYTDRASYTWSNVKYVSNKTFGSISSNLTLDSGGQYNYGYMFQKNTTSGSTSNIDIKIENPNFASVPVKVYAQQRDASNTNISLTQIQVGKYKYYYDPELDSMTPTIDNVVTIDPPATDIKTEQVTLDIPSMPGQESGTYFVQLKFTYTKKDGANDFGWSGDLYVDYNNGEASGIMTGSDGDYNYYYSYLPIRERKLTPIGEYYWMKGTTFQPIYSWTYEWATVDNTRQKKTRYNLVMDYGWDNNVSMDIIGIISWNDSFYMIGNMEGNGYIIPCDLTGGRGTPYIAYGCEFKGVANIDYLMYLVGEDRGISQLWVYNGQEMVSIIGGSEEKDTKNLIDNAEQYKFDGKMVEYRDDLILSTSDNRIFAYGQTFGGKGGTFIHQLPGTIKELKADGKDLSVKYTLNSTDYVTVLQDDTPIKNYNTEWMAEYPIVIGNHLLEKEESDLYASYILPSANCSLEFWGMANHYHFWTFKTDGNTTPSAGSSWVIDGSDGNYRLEFVEKNDEYLTFKLIGELPVMTGDETGRLAKYLAIGSQTYIGYSDFNHFRKIGEITTTEYQEGEFRFHNLNNKLDLPKSHSLQIMVKGKGTANHTPELFSVDLVANQRERG